MTSSAVARPFECAPHAIRSVAMAVTVSLNLAIVMFALLPHTPIVTRVPPPASLLAAILQPMPPLPVLPAAPSVRVEQRVAVPALQVPAARPAPLSVPIPAAAPATNTAPTMVPAAGAAAVGGDSEATIAYATATPPVYPVQALRAGVQGTVLLRVLVDARGVPVQVMIEHGSGSRALDAAARAHILAAWRFHPAVRDGHAIEAWALVPIRFSLDRG